MFWKRCYASGNTTHQIFFLADTPAKLSDLAAGNGGQRELAQGAEQALLDNPWPGNIRELKHCLERACVLFPNGPLNVATLFGDYQPPAQTALVVATLSDYLNGHERECIERVLRANDGRIADTAAALGISRKDLWEKMKKLQIQEEG